MFQRVQQVYDILLGVAGIVRFHLLWFHVLVYCLSNAMHGQNVNLPVCVCLSVCVCVRHTFCQLAYRSDPSTDFYS